MERFKRGLIDNHNIIMWLIFIILISSMLRAEAQDTVSNVTYVLSPDFAIKINPFTRLFLNSDYIVVGDSLNKLKRPVLKVYYCSATIYDESEIVLIDHSRFFCYYIGCTSRFYSAGRYKLNGDILQLYPNARFAKQIKRLILPEVKEDVTFGNLQETLFQRTGSKLLLTNAGKSGNTKSIPN